MPEPADGAATATLAAPAPPPPALAVNPAPPRGPLLVLEPTETQMTTTTTKCAARGCKHDVPPRHVGGRAPSPATTDMCGAHRKMTRDRVHRLRCTPEEAARHYREGDAPARRRPAGTARRRGSVRPAPAPRDEAAPAREPSLTDAAGLVARAMRAVDALGGVERAERLAAALGSAP